MAKNSVKIIALVLAILLICSGVVFIIFNNKTLAYSSSRRVYISESESNFGALSNYYCLNKNLKYDPGYYVLVNEGLLDPTVAYAIGYERFERQLGKTHSNEDAIANIVWDYMGDGRVQGMEILYSEEFYDIVAKAELIQNLSENDVSISSLETMLIQNSEGQYGPFTINFPNINDELVGKELKIIVNGTNEIAIEDLIKKDDGYYLTEEHGIQVGAENTIELAYTAWQYTGSYIEYAFEQNYEMQITCSECDGTGTFVWPGICYMVNGQLVKEQYENAGWTETVVFAHTTEDCAGEIVQTLVEPSYYAHQNIIEPFVECIPFLLYADLTFLAGTPDLEIDFNKVNTEGEKLEGAIFDVNVVGGTVEGSSTITTTKEGNVLRIKPDKGSIAMTVTLTELKAPDKYAPLTESIILQYTWNTDTKQWDCNKSNVVLQNGEKVTIERSTIVDTEDNATKYIITAENRAIIEDLIIRKINKFAPDEGIDGIIFDISIKNATIGGNQSVRKETTSGGIIDLGTLEVIDISKDIEITLVEIGTPSDGLDYGDLVNTPVTIKFKHNVEGCKTDNSLVIAEYDLDNNIVEIQIENEVTMDLSGMVWEDGQTGIKPVQSPNGVKDSSESGISGIIVNLVKGDGTIQNTAITDNSGYYEFTKVPASTKGAFGYYIEFIYDGINYIATQTGGDSDATEKDRLSFNNKFETITKGMAVGTTGITTGLNYTYDASGAKLQTMSGGYVKEEFAIKADTLSTTYNATTSNIDLGLVKKDVDLAAVTDIHSATVKINGEIKSYDYNDIASLEKDENGNPIIGDLQEEAQYNLYLYNSDYNYRIGDYHLPAARSIVYDSSSASSLLTQRQNDGELNVEVTYQVLLSNQSATDAMVNQIAYYYDSRYELTGISIDYGTIEVRQIIENAATTGSVTYNKAIIDVTEMLIDSDSQKVIQLTFNIKKDTSGNIYTGIMENIVEIISYSTDSGCVDSDSAPDNIEINGNEDDTDDAAGLNIKLNNIERQVSGYVFEDSKPNESSQYNTGDGLYDESNPSETKIDDVIVQLIEIKDVTVGGTALRLEYIWQETVSGSNTVRYVTSDGLSEGTYTVSNEKGQYTFNKNIIPGDYIVRFIYGDGTYYDTTSAANLFKYNGQDYKSTIDVGYDKTSYREEVYSQNSSMARDNEARRLEEMAYATSVTNASDLNIDTQDKLNATWMCAETSPVLMKISDAVVEGDINAIAKSINFGLVERPRANLGLEKHITGLYISGSNGVNATTTMGEYEFAKSNGLVVDVSDNDIFATSTDKGENHRGVWKLETEADKIGGEELRITYSYAVKNVGDLDYIGEELRRKLNEEGKTYSEIAAEVKALTSKPNYIPGTYLGTAYYNGNKTTDVSSAIKFQVEDYISSTNGLKLDTTTDFKVANPATATKNVWDYINSGSSDRSHTNTATEQVQVLQSDVYTLSADGETQLTLTVYDDSIDTTSSAGDMTYRSYAAQLINSTSGSITSQSGTLCNTVVTFGNLKTVQSYVVESGVPILDIVPEDDEFIAETVVITKDTGGDKATPIFLITTITAGLAIVVVGIVVIKKFVIK